MVVCYVCIFNFSSYDPLSNINILNDLNRNLVLCIYEDEARKCTHAKKKIRKQSRLARD